MAEQVSRGWTNVDHVYTKRRTTKERRQAERVRTREMLQELRGALHAVRLQARLLEDVDLEGPPPKDAYAGYDD